MEELASQSVCAVVVNWNGWRDTVVCIESLLALDEALLRIIVCDNGSTDGSTSQLRQWLSSRPVHEQAAVDILPLAANLGYAGAINAGIRSAQSHAPQFFWLLNNDVRALPGALRELLVAFHSVPFAGVCGSVLLDWDSPHDVQAIGGIYHKAIGVAHHLRRVAQKPRSGEVCLEIDYPVGASLLVAQDYLNRVGLMDDSYFLYYEELDWVERGRRLGLRPVVALGSRVLHKEGASTGSHGGVRRKSLLSERYGVINRLRITRKFWPYWLPVVWASLLLVIGDRLLHGEVARARLVLRVMVSPSQWIGHRSRGRRGQA